jgi:hypothetical protein
VVPPCAGIFFNIAGTLWIIDGTGIDKSLRANDCCTGAGKVDVVVIGMIIPLLKVYKIPNHQER